MICTSEKEVSNQHSQVDPQLPGRLLDSTSRKAGFSPQQLVAHHHELDNLLGTDCILEPALKVEDRLAQPIHDGLPLASNTLALQEGRLCLCVQQHTDLSARPPNTSAVKQQMRQALV